MAGHSPWDPVKLKVLNEEYGIEGVPGLLEVVYGDVDTPRSTLHQMPQTAFYATPFYRNWAAPQGLRDACVMKFVQTADRVGLVASVTSAQRDIVTADERQFMALLSPHLRRAAMIGDLLDHQRVETSVFRHALDQLIAPVILVDAHCKILYANASAHSMLESGQLVRANGGVFSPTNPLMRAALADAVLRAAGQAGDLGSRGMGIPVADRAHHAAGAAALAYVLPLKNSAIRSVFNPAVAAIFIATALSHHAPPADVLASVFDLTPSEARVMQMVGTGSSTPAVAAELGVSETTVKTHLAKVFSKTGVNRQAQLVQLVSSLSSPVGSLNPAGVRIG
jgi:DNA-binding CsgD family transcriptional regulator/PAS domain-containing protein